jgi:hypothetical protein
VRFFLDNDVPDQVGWVLRRESHSVLRLREVMPRWTADAEALFYCLENQLILITCNRKDYLDLCASRDHYGVIIVNRRERRSSEAAAVLKLVRRAGESGLVRNINFA